MKKILALLMTLTMLLSLAACGGKDKNISDAAGIGSTLEALKTATYQDSGYWELIRIDSENPEDAVSEEDFSMLKEMQLVMYLELFEDGTGVLVADEEEALTWKDGAVCADGETVVYTKENGNLFMSQDGTTLVFRKGEKPAFLYSELEAAGFSEYIELGVLYPFTTNVQTETSVPTTGEVIITSYEIFDSAEGYPAKEGYEWRVVTMEAVFFDDNARWYGIDIRTCSEDYYNTKLHDDTITEPDADGFKTTLVIYNGTEMETYERYTGEWSGWHNREDGRRQNLLSSKYEYLMPKGYDGRVVGFVNGKNEWERGSSYIIDFDPADCMLFRLN